MRPIQVHNRQRKYKTHVLIDLIIIVAITFGIAVNLANTPTVMGRWRLFIYFTIQANLMMLALCFWSILSERLSKLYQWMRTGTTLYLVVTMVGYHFLLSAIHAPGGMAGVANGLLHYVVPILALATWLGYMRRHELRWWTAFGWLIYPLVYSVTTLIRGMVTGIYPYWFLNPTVPYPDGIGTILRLGIFLLIMTVVLMVLGIAMCLINNRTRKNG